VQIDWFTLVAQIINFVILIYLLKRFLYGPIIEMMDQREKRIAEQIEAAERIRNEAEEQKARYRRHQRKLDEEHDDRLAAVQREVEDRRRELLEEARQDVQKRQRSWQESLRHEQDAFLRELRYRIGHEAREIARQSLQDLADVQVEQRMAELFMARLQDLDSAAKSKIVESIQTSSRGVVICSTFELPKEMQKSIADVISAQIMDGQRLDTHFETSPDLISGIEMQVDGYQITWSIRDYLAGLEERVRQTIEQEAEMWREGAHDA
jgi:F-type H+-transporting ATPase subunit b